jgi:hypothetical protein
MLEGSSFICLKKELEITVQDALATHAIRTGNTLRSIGHINLWRAESKHEEET